MTYLITTTVQQNCNTHFLSLQTMAKIAKPAKKPFYIFNGFEVGLKPKVIINMKQVSGKNYFLTKWWKTEAPTYLEAEVAKHKCPILVCEFYQKHIIIDDII